MGGSDDCEYSKVITSELLVNGAEIEGFYKVSFTIVFIDGFKRLVWLTVNTI